MDTLCKKILLSLGNTFFFSEVTGDLPEDRVIVTLSASTLMDQGGRFRLTRSEDREFRGKQYPHYLISRANQVEPGGVECGRLRASLVS